MFVKQVICAITAIAIIFPLCGFSIEQAPEGFGQPLDERKVQEGLPQSHDSIWDSFTKCAVALDEKSYTYSIDYTPEVKAMEGERITVSGFMLPLESTEKFTRFLLTKRTPTCMFCPPGEPNEMVDVWLDSPTEWSEEMVSVTGTFSFTKEQQLGMFFKLSDAKIFVPKPPKMGQELW